MGALGEYLRNRRKELGLTLREVAERTGVSNSYISQIESGQRKIPSARVLGLLARAYELDAGDLMNLATGNEDAFDEEATTIDRLFQHAINDPDFKYGNRFRGKLTTEMKRAVIEVYEDIMGKKLLRRD